MFWLFNIGDGVVEDIDEVWLRLLVLIVLLLSMLAGNIWGDILGDNWDGDNDADTQLRIGTKDVDAG